MKLYLTLEDDDGQKAERVMKYIAEGQGFKDVENVVVEMIEQLTTEF